MTDTPTPPVPAGLDVRCFPTMPLDVARLRNSETWILSTPAERSAAINLWAASWHAVPAGSLPNDDRVLAHHSMAGADWPNVKPMALRGWVPCSDGRLYHSVVCQFAVEADAQKRDATKTKDKKREAMREWRRSQLRGDHVATTETERADRLEGIRVDGNGVDQSAHTRAAPNEEAIEEAKAEVRASVAILEQIKAAVGTGNPHVIGWPASTVTGWRKQGWTDGDILDGVRRSIAGKSPDEIASIRTLKFFEGAIADTARAAGSPTISPKPQPKTLEYYDQLGR